MRTRSRYLSCEVLILHMTLNFILCILLFLFRLISLILFFSFSSTLSIFLFHSFFILVTSALYNGILVNNFFSYTSFFFFFFSVKTNDDLAQVLEHTKLSASLIYNFYQYHCSRKGDKDHTYTSVTTK